MSASYVFRYIRALTFHTRCCAVHEIGNAIGQFAKWAAAWTQCLFHELGNTLADFVKWAVSQIERNATHVP